MLNRTEINTKVFKESLFLIKCKGECRFYTMLKWFTVLYVLISRLQYQTVHCKTAKWIFLTMIKSQDKLNDIDCQMQLQTNALSVMWAGKTKHLKCNRCFLDFYWHFKVFAPCSLETNAHETHEKWPWGNYGNPETSYPPPDVQQNTNSNLHKQKRRARMLA